MNKGIILLAALMLNAPFTAACTRPEAEVAETPAAEAVRAELPDNGNAAAQAFDNQAVETEASESEGSGEYNAGSGRAQTGSPAWETGLSTEIAQASNNDASAAFRAKRYIEPSTRTRFLLLKIKKADSPEVLTIVTDNEEWVLYSNTFKYTESNTLQDYINFMMAHDSEPFVLDDKAFEKFKKDAVEPLPKELTELSDEELIKRYTIVDDEKYGRGAGRKLRFDAGLKWRDLLHLFLARGCVLQQGCLDSSVNVYFPSGYDDPGF